MENLDKISEEELIKAYACAKGWRTRKIKIVRRMVQGFSIKFDHSNCNKLQKELNALGSQVYTTKDITECLGDIQLADTPGRLQESTRYEMDLQDIPTKTFDHSNNQDLDSLKWTAIMGGHPGRQLEGPQLPVMALDQDRLAFSITTAD